jgi:[ribosomal protein S18]-alanine N-acetyltransferase
VVSTVLANGDRVALPSGGVLTLLRRPPTDEEAGELSTWAYPPPFDLYDADPGNPQLFLTRSPDGEGYYPAVDEDGRLVAFAVIGAEARVRGQEPAGGVVDVGVGVRPDATGSGLGTALMEQAIALARDLGATSAVRAAVATFNERSLALCRSAGFRPVRDFEGPGGRAFRELVLRLRDDG